MKYYKVTKIEITTEKMSDYGIMCEEDVKLVTKGYTLNHDFSIMSTGKLVYDRKNGKYMVFADEVKQSY